MVYGCIMSLKHIAMMKMLRWRNILPFFQHNSDILRPPGTVLCIRYTTVVGVGGDQHKTASWSSKISRWGKQKSHPGAIVRCSLASPLFLSINFCHRFFPPSLNYSSYLLPQALCSLWMEHQQDPLCPHTGAVWTRERVDIAWDMGNRG